MIATQHLRDQSGECPKHMTDGPCGGVRSDGTCELGTLACPWVTAPTPVSARAPASAGALAPTPVNARAPASAGALAPTPAAAPAPPGPRAGAPGARPEPTLRALTLRARLEAGGVVVVDGPARALDAASLRACASTLTGVDAILCGDAPNHRVQFPPAFRAELVHAVGATAWVGLNARDRNRVALEGELAALAALGVGAVHCVTGDHPALGHRPDAGPVFDLDSVALTALAARGPMVVSVAESPAAPPVSARPARLGRKEAAGAEVCFVNHCGGVGSALTFVRAARALGSTAAMIACVPLAVDAASVATLLSFVPPDADRVGLERILTASDPRRAGIAAAIGAGRAMLDTGEMAGVNLSGGPAEGEELAYADALATVADALAR